MRRVGQTRRRDRNERDIIQALRDVGADVTPISGKGAPDILVRFRDVLVGWEIKSGSGRRTLAQEASKWPIIRSVDEALERLGEALND